jgi:hypothetical protein
MRINTNAGTQWVDCNYGADEMYLALGRQFTFDTPIVNLTVGQYLGIVFTTPPAPTRQGVQPDVIIFEFPSVEKSGDDLSVEVLLNPTVGAGGTAYSFLNTKHYSPNTSPVTDQRYGLSTAMTITGGQQRALHFVSGLASAQNSSPNSVQRASLSLLVPGAIYGVKITALTGAVKLHCSLSMAEVKYGT